MTVIETFIRFKKDASGNWVYVQRRGEDNTKDYFVYLKDGKWYAIKGENYPQSEEERDDAVIRARQYINKEEYSFLTNNCEHFVTEVLMGKGISYQVRNPITKGK